MIAGARKVNAHRLAALVRPAHRQQRLEVRIARRLRHQARQIQLQRREEFALNDVVFGGLLLVRDLDVIVGRHQFVAALPVGDFLAELEESASLHKNNINAGLSYCTHVCCLQIVDIIYQHIM